MCCLPGILSCPGLTKEVDVALKTKRNKLPTGPVGNELDSGHVFESSTPQRSAPSCPVAEREGLFSQVTEY